MFLKKSVADMFSPLNRDAKVSLYVNINDSRKNKMMTIRMEGNCRSHILEKLEGMVEKSRIHMENLAFNRSYYTIQELNWQGSDYIDGSPTSVIPG